MRTIAELPEYSGELNGDIVLPVVDTITPDGKFCVTQKIRLADLIKYIVSGAENCGCGVLIKDGFIIITKGKEDELW